ncbi:LysM peptidoglycan-binding domain-containing protein [Hymenobacter terrenus]|uniref:LysM peptidoglycan-binding domain-containing protein n=1 Tax=Hymenobacter terrenus TaxID=1629124 RepID=UPI000A7E6A5C|nr:LysM peptidoglycan-binding domain-containing protein [Hymenobacter terrenus]
MRNSVVLFVVLGLGLAGPLAAQPVVSRPHPDVPAAFDVAGLHLVLNEEAQRLVQQKADGLCRHQPSFQARVDLADAAFPIIDRVLKEEGVPLDFRYLPLQESALQGNARSPHEAVGYWQLKQETATELGLVVSDAVDERQHLTASTRAAARYLSRSNASLRNWLNALLSYNTGLGGVKPYTLPTDANATEIAITEATSPYVLMFLAQKIAFEPACGQNPKPPLLLQEFPAVAGQTLEAQALTLHTDPAALATHNHWLLAPTVPADRPYTLIVPVGDVTQAAGIVANQRLQSGKELLTMPAVAANSAEVRVNNLRALIALPGETTMDLARRGHQKLGDFLRHNELRAFDMAVPGRPYYLESKRNVAAVEYHVAQPGETVLDVAQKYGIRRKAIFSKNRMSRFDDLRPGRVLWLQHTRPREVAVEYRSLPEGVALERPTAGSAAANTDVLIDRANEIVVAQRERAPEDGKVKVKIKVKNGTTETKQVVTEEADGWGEALSTATAAAAPAAAPVAVPAPATPAVPAPEVAPLSSPAPAPAPTPLADEPSEPEPATEPAVVESSKPEPVAAPPAVASKPIPAPELVSAPPARSVTPAMPSPAPVVAAKPATASPKPVTASAPGGAAGTTHRVEPHETVYSISRLYGIPPATLMEVNRLTPPANLAVGQVLILPGRAPLSVAAVPVAKPVQAPVVAAARPGSKVNPALYVPKKAAPAAPATSAPVAAGATQHTVVKGETLFSISRQYNVKVADLQAWNAKPDQSVKVGEVLRVQAAGK